VAMGAMMVAEVMSSSAALICCVNKVTLFDY
jgi:hypothetical protein